MTASLLLGHVEIAELLIQNGADVNVVEPSGHYALTLAAIKGKKYAQRKS